MAYVRSSPRQVRLSGYQLVVPGEEADVEGLALALIDDAIQQLGDLIRGLVDPHRLLVRQLDRNQSILLRSLLLVTQLCADHVPLVEDQLLLREPPGTAQVLRAGRRGAACLSCLFVLVSLFVCRTHSARSRSANAA